ncbi:hypothetical protein ACFFJT_10940 [Dyella flava]|uniref:Uncharacterized protein n=1 Tax=Dyella flava TaxID=1920170 RepID=A0ABS2JYA2_9GAMM|nr:hypothetical protein [Dyella flava]MBM7123956.1 hypothetical protein [Dyella flava]GLQ52518.1 hypothetical protein GCM10010872_39670 [Dyella flava]
MKEHAPGAWITLNASYYIAPVCHPGRLQDDADLLLDGAQGIIQSLGDRVGQGVDTDPDNFASALWAAAILIQMGQRSAHEAHKRLNCILKMEHDAEDDEVTE